jgi:ATP-binding cassette subfamily C protein CydC
MAPDHGSRSATVRVLSELDAGGLAFAALDLLARALLPASVIVVTRGAADEGWRLALVTQGLVVARGAWAGRRLETELVRTWSSIVDAAARHALGFLRVQAPGREASRLVYAALRVAHVRAAILPKLVADVAGLAVVAVAVSMLLGGRWLAAAGLGVLVLLPLARWAAREVRRVERVGHEAIEALVGDCGLVIDGALEVRAHGVIELAREVAAREARRAASTRRRSTRARSLFAMLPLSLAVVAATAPPIVRLLPVGVPLATAAMLGGTALAFATSLIASLEELAASEPQRDAVARFTDVTSSPQVRVGGGSREAGWFRAKPLAFEAVSIRHQGNPTDTPHAFAHRWDTTRGLALVGPNGAGKSTLVAGLLGLVPLASGELRSGDAPWTEEDACALRSGVVLVPQRPYTVPSRSIGWHLRLFAPEATDDELVRALERLKLRERLERRAPGAPLDVAAGELSGGELARLHLTRIVVPRRGRPPELIVVDEPEAGLDLEGRLLVRELLATATGTSAVLVVAHDASVVPEGFQRVSCHASP